MKIEWALFACSFWKFQCENIRWTRHFGDTLDSFIIFIYFWKAGYFICQQIWKLFTAISQLCSQCSSSRILMPCSQRPVWLICSATINYVTLDYVITYRRWARLGILTSVRRRTSAEQPLLTLHLVRTRACFTQLDFCWNSLYTIAFTSVRLV